MHTHSHTKQNLKKFLTKNIVKKELSDKLAVADSKLGGVIKEKLEIKCINDSSVMELMRGIRLQLDSLLTGVGEANLKQMRLGLSHSLSRYKLKFSADKVSPCLHYAAPI
jgi:nucleolar protein 58